MSNMQLLPVIEPLPLLGSVGLCLSLSLLFPGSVQGRVGVGLEQSAPVEGVSAHGVEVDEI